MDLHTVGAYLRPVNLEEVQGWQSDWAWLAGGTWMFSEPQVNLKTLVDLQGLNWSELEVTAEGLWIGATCVMSRLLQQQYPEGWTGVKALQSAVHELASFKIQNMATIAGNLCLALPAGTFAPVMLLLNAKYEILSPSGLPIWVAAREFQTGARQTQLKSGEVLRRIFIPQDKLQWRVSYRRICVATAGLAVAIVVAAYDPLSRQVRFAIGASFPAPRLLEFPQPPTAAEITAALAQIPLSQFLEDGQTSPVYRRHITQVLMVRSLAEAMGVQAIDGEGNP